LLAAATRKGDYRDVALKSVLYDLLSYEKEAERLGQLLSRYENVVLLGLVLRSSSGGRWYVEEADELGVAADSEKR